METSSIYDDNQVMNRVRDGKVEMLAILFERYHKRIFNFMIRLSGERQVSEDLTQEVFFRILKYRHTFREKSQFTFWIYQIARNVHFDYLRKFHHESPVEDLENEPDGNPLPADRVTRDQEHSLLQEALTHLPPKKREVLVLSRFHHMKYKEIAELMGCSIQSVKVEAHRGLKALRDVFFQLKGGTT